MYIETILVYRELDSIFLIIVDSDAKIIGALVDLMNTSFSKCDEK